MEERRKFVRLDTRVEVSYQVLPSAQLHQSLTKNIGGGGICFFAQEVLPPGTKVRAMMKLPDRQDLIQFTGEVVWSEPYEVIGKTERRKSVEVGVQFVEVDPKDREAIMGHVILGLKPPQVS